jgi:hypothetical protein
VVDYWYRERQTLVSSLLFRAYLSPSGNDANACTLLAPCRLLPAALNAVVDGGEIWMLGSANYNTGTVNVGKSVSILAVPGVVGSVVALNGGPAIRIAADGLRVALRNLVIGPVAGTTPGTDGVQMTGASTLVIEDSLIANVPANGVRIDGSGAGKLARTMLRNNGQYAILLTGGASAGVSATQMLANGAGGFSAQVSAAGTSASNISDSIIAGGADGVHARAVVAGAAARIAVTRSVVQGTGFPLLSYTSGTGAASIAVSDSLIANNASAWYQSGAGAVIRSLGNNHIIDNGAPTGTLTPIPLQ